MSGQKAKAIPQFPIAISPPGLWRLDFERKYTTESSPRTSEEVPLQTGLRIARLADDEIGVELTIRLTDLPQFSIEVSYRAEFQVNATEQIGDLDSALRTIAARIAPATLYPFVRETIANTVVKAGLELPLLPVLNFGTMFNPDELELPRPSEGDK